LKIKIGLKIKERSFIYRFIDAGYYSAIKGELV